MTTLSDTFTLPQSQVGGGSNTLPNTGNTWKPDTTTAFNTDDREFSIGFIPVSTNALISGSGLNVIINDASVQNTITYLYSPNQDFSKIIQTTLTSNAGGTSLRILLVILDSNSGPIEIGPVSPDISGNFIFNYPNTSRKSVTGVVLVFTTDPETVIDALITGMTSFNLPLPPPIIIPPIPISNNICGY